MQGVSNPKTRLSSFSSKMALASIGTMTSIMSKIYIHVLPTRLIKRVNEFIDRQLFPVAGIAPSIPNELRQLADGLSIEDRLLNFIDDLDQFFLLRIQSEESRLARAPMLSATIDAIKYGRQMLEMIKKDINNLHTQTQDTGIEKAAVKEILILHINGFLYDLRKLVSSFHKISIVLNGTLPIPPHKLNHGHMIGILNMIQGLQASFTSDVEVLNVLTRWRQTKPTAAWQNDLLNTIISCDRSAYIKIMNSMVEAQQYDYVLLKTKINSILVMAELCKRKLGSSSLLETMLLQFKITYFNEKAARGNNQALRSDPDFIQGTIEARPMKSEALSLRPTAKAI